MMRQTIATYTLNTARSFGQILGCEIAVETSNHSIETSMEVPDRTSRAWDEQLYKSGNLFVKGYANPYKPTVEHNPELSEPDSIDVNKGNENDETDTTEKERKKVELISSSRYRSYMHQNLISELLNPREQWKLVVYAVLGLAGLMLINVMITMSNSGAF